MRKTLAASIAGVMLACVAPPALAAIPLDVPPGAFDFTLRGHPVHADEVEHARLSGYSTLLLAQLRHYPGGVLDAYGPRRILMVGQISAGGTPYNAMCDWDRRVLTFKALDLASERHDALICIHHELFHMIDNLARGPSWEDAAWDALNEPGFRYGDGGDSMRDAADAELTERIPGCVTRYASSATDEDKAETFAHLIVDRGWVLARAREDRYLAAKIALLRLRLDALSTGWGRSL